MIFLWRYDPTRTRASSFTRFLDHTQRRTTVGRTPLEEWSARTQGPLTDNTQQSQHTDLHVPAEIRTRNLSRRATADLRLRLRGDRDGLLALISFNFWRRNYFFILAHPIYKMWIIQEPDTLELWNKLHFEEEKKRRVYTVFKVFIIYICWINI